MPQTVPQTAYKDIGYGENLGVCCLSQSSKLINAYKLEGDQAQSALNQPSEGYKVVDSSEPFFSINSNATEQEDNKMVERWQNDANGILIFVSPRLTIHAVLYIIWNTIDRSILCCSCCAPCCDHPGPETKQSGDLHILSWEHL